MPRPRVKLRFTVRALDALPAAAAGRREYFNDDLVAGLQVAVTAHGTKTFCVYRKINGVPKRLRLGAYPDLTIEQARARARTMLTAIAEGRDPDAERKAAQIRAITLDAVFEDFLAARKNLKPRTVRDYQGVVAVAFPDWRQRPLTAITKDMVARRHAQFGAEHGEAYANQAMRVLRALCNFAIATYENADGSPLLAENPVRRLSQTRAWFRVKRRERLIHDHELPAWFAAVRALGAEDPDGAGGACADYLQVVLYTGLRRNEALALPWRDVDFADRTLTVRDTKNHCDHTLPLSHELLDLLARRRQALPHAEYVFPGPGSAGHLTDPRGGIRQVIARSGIPFSLHDLRRTFATIAAGLGIPYPIVKRLLNHKVGNDVTGGYIIPDLASLRGPMQRISDALRSRAEPPTGRVVLPFARIEGRTP